jgi:Na+-driven multidrug efflux pump
MTIRMTGRLAGPAVVTAVTAAASWTALALAVPMITTTDVAALAVVLGSGLVVAASYRGAGRRLLPRVLGTAAGSALLIFLVIAWFLPAVPGYVSNNHPPIYTPVTRLVDPIGELALSVLLTLLLVVEVVHARTRIRRAAARAQGQVAGPNEMIVERAG